MCSWVAVDTVKVNKLMLSSEKQPKESPIRGPRSLHSDHGSTAIPAAAANTPFKVPGRTPRRLVNAEVVVARDRSPEWDRNRLEETRSHFNSTDPRDKPMDLMRKETPETPIRVATAPTKAQCPKMTNFDAFGLKRANLG